MFFEWAYLIISFIGLTSPKTLVTWAIDMTFVFLLIAFFTFSNVTLLFSRSIYFTFISFPNSNHGRTLEACSALVINTSSFGFNLFLKYPNTILFNASVVL